MGQAKRRGTFEERKTQAIEREAKRRESAANRPVNKPSRMGGVLALLAAQALVPSR